MLGSLGRNLARFRVSLALAVAASMALAAWAPASAAAPHLTARPLGQIAHLSPSTLAPGAPFAVLIHPVSERKDTTSATIYSLDSSTAKIKTTSGKVRQEAVYASKTGPDGDANISLTLSRSSGNMGLLLGSPEVAGREAQKRHNQPPFQMADNDWELSNLRPSEFSVHHGNATIGFNSTQVGPFGRLFGAFTHTKKTKESCNVSGSEFMYTGILKVNELFKTKNSLEHHSKLGSVHGPSGRGGTVIFPHAAKATTTLFVDNNCVNTLPPPPKAYCVSGTVWVSPTMDLHAGSQVLGGYKLTFHSPNPSSLILVFASRFVTFSGLPSTGGFAGTPAAVTRSDQVDDSAPSQAYSQSAANPFPQTETVAAGARDKYIQGGATLTSSASATETDEPCFVGDTTETQFTQRGQAPFSWTNGATNLTADSAVGKNISIANTTTDTTATINHDSSH